MQQRTSLCLEPHREAAVILGCPGSPFSPPVPTSTVCPVWAVANGYPGDWLHTKRLDSREMLGHLFLGVNQKTFPNFIGVRGGELSRKMYAKWYPQSLNSLSLKRGRLQKTEQRQ